ncbi:succinylglutamate desuccinylase/aspartoacylase [Halorubrum saccharovorum DSM 1137]|uniref:Succinylglutamate desuccinylase/aspartoacylase n=1 Tax=Halorubrum saccharovorum DSM 1137 TaxID=1227484 RepID=M0E3J0_9EURY|nr:succinylglutamate desuccinylase/aspartoacylase family protein [Halorubrum saccharovorum]ELZ40919.1 succinylglutamate desuccinylase/aspartoacylase [Halorubrum saccharovorum DSM 1137]
MDVHDLGEGEPEVAVVGAIHGDEPCGARAVRRLLDADLDLERPVRLIVANEAALDAGVRYLDADLNRAFPGDPDAEAHEERLAAELLDALDGCSTLAIHSTQSYAEPFAVVDSMDEVARAVAPHLPVDAVIQTDAFTEGRLIEHPHTLEVEAGLQGSDAAADNAYWLARAFLAATGVITAPGAESVVDAGGREDVEVFRLRDRIPKPDADVYEVFARNFERVEAGEAFAAADDEQLRADDPFYPVLLSPYGYRDQFGYVADRVGTIE